jgi:hypothetical protein
MVLSLGGKALRQVCAKPAGCGRVIKLGRNGNKAALPHFLALLQA